MKFSGMMMVAVAVLALSVSRAGAEPFEPCICTLQYDPVCCYVRGRIYTASNPCFCSGCGGPGRILYHGQCRHYPTYGPPVTYRPPVTISPVTRPTVPITPVTRPSAPITLPTRPTGRFPPPGDCVCPQVYDPVCCQSPSGAIYVASNSCMCGCSGGTGLDDSKCDINPTERMAKKEAAVGIKPVAKIKVSNKQTSVKPFYGPELPWACPCPKIYMPVCCKTKFGLYTAANKCICDCFGGIVHSKGKCPLNEKKCLLACPINIQGACCRFGKELVVEASRCACECKKGIFVSEGECPVLE